MLVALAAACASSLALPAGALALDAAALQRSLNRAVSSAGAGGAGAIVRDLDTGTTLFARRPDVERVPASVEKLYTTSTVLRRFGPKARLTTRVVRVGEVDADGRLDGDLVLVGGGDPTLDRSAVMRLARMVGRSGISRVGGSVLGDETRFDGHRGGPRTGGAYDGDLGGVLGGLTVERGFAAGDAGPALGAARRLSAALRHLHIKVLGRTGTGAAPKRARQVARVRSPAMAELARRTNVPSDNFYAETLLKNLGAAYGTRGSTAAGAAVVRDELSRLGLHPHVADGSGLSRANRTSPRQVITLLSGMRGTPQGSAFLSSLAVAGRTGTLSGRMRRTSAAGACRGKTGTLNRVSALAGLCTTREGHTLAFALLMNGVDVNRARVAQDRAASAIAGYVSHPLVGRLPND